MKSKNTGVSEYIKGILAARKTGLARDLVAQDKEIAELETRLFQLKKYREDIVKFIKEIEDHLKK